VFHVKRFATIKIYGAQKFSMRLESFFAWFILIEL
jgi:hypothetical protein